MIRMGSSRSVLARFVRDLEQSSPREVGHIVPRLSDYTRADIEAAQVVWAMRIVDEYRSVVIFADLLRLLSECEAPFEATCAIHRLIGDELLHVRFCASVLDALGGSERLEIELDDLGLPPTDEPAASRALEIVAREIAVAETESVEVIRAFSEATSDPAVHDVLRRLLADEARHAAAGRELTRLLAAELPRDDVEPFLSRMPETLDADRADIRARYLASANGGPGRGLGGSLLAVDLRFATAA